MALRTARTSHIILALFASTVILLVAFQYTGSYERLKQTWHAPVSSDQEQSEQEQEWDTTKWGFQVDMPWYKLPLLSLDVIQAPPVNYNGPGHETYATFFATRDATLSDPYFLAALQIVYRLLWRPESKSTTHPVVVFVAPFVSQAHRDYFAAAGAMVRELPLRPFTPEHGGAAGRLRDMFSKLEMWHQTDFSKITYLDSDAFPLVNVDSIFKLAIEQDCKKDLLPPEDQSNAADICRYVFSGYEDLGSVNAGVMVFSPNVHMFDRLVRESLNQSSFDNGFMEQALLALAYNKEGPFPPSFISHAYNGGVDTIEQGKPLYIVHHKLWNTGWDPETSWYYNTFNETWMEMLEFYQTDRFRDARLAHNSSMS